MNPKSLLVLSLLCASGGAEAQNCPSGIPSAGNPQCIPPTVQGSPYYQPPAVPQPPRAQWKLTWGAIATDSTTGDIGVTVGHFSRGKAKREAMSRCATYGAEKCKVVLAYKNQCAVYAKPAENGKPVAGLAFAQGGPSIEVATELGLAACREARGGGECSIVFSDCTRPVLVQD